MRPVLFLAVAFSLFAASSGCGVKLNMESSFEATTAGKDFTLEPVKREQTVKATVTATGAPVSVYIFLEKDLDKAEKEIMAAKFSGIMLARQEKTEQATIEAVIPANQAAMVRVMRATNTPAQVKLKITNR